MLIRTSTPLDTQIVRLAITQRRLLFVNPVEMLQAKRIEAENNVAASCGIHSENTKSEVARCESRRPRCVAGRSKLTNGSWQQTWVRWDSCYTAGYHTGFRRYKSIKSFILSYIVLLLVENIDRAASASAVSRAIREHATATILCSVLYCVTTTYRWK